MEPEKQNTKIIPIRPDIERLEFKQKIKKLEEDRAYLEGIINAPNAFESPDYDDMMKDANSRLKMITDEIDKMNKIMPDDQKDQTAAKTEVA